MIDKQKTDMDKIKIEYKGKVYSFQEAIDDNIITYQTEQKRLVTHGDAMGDCEITKYGGFRVNYDNVSLIYDECKMTLGCKDVIQFNIENDLDQIRCESHDHMVTIGDKNIKTDNSSIYFIRQTNTGSNDKTYIHFITNNIVETQIDGQTLFLTDAIHVDSATGQMTRGRLCSEYDNEKCPDFSCNINGNKLEINGVDKCDIEIQDNQITWININCRDQDYEKQIPDVKYNEREVFFPKHGCMYISKIDDTIFYNKKKASGVNFSLYCMDDNISKDDIDNKYINAGILNLNIGGKKFKDTCGFDYTIYENGYMLAKHCDDDAYLAQKIDNDNTYEVIFRYSVPDDIKYCYNLCDKKVLDFVNNFNIPRINNQPVDGKNLSKGINNDNKGLKKK
ncbi:MAG: hypothetical protein IJT15_03030 [Rickettsiales bacterium]|nr:hypothetical protein [Rickettsiales bacterium]